jgi:hypothetical protein
LKELFETQPGVQYGRGSYWQAYNAITYWLDHERGRNDENRLNASWFGDGQQIRDRALKLALPQVAEETPLHKSPDEPVKLRRNGEAIPRSDKTQTEKTR